MNKVQLKQASEKVALASYLSITRAAGLPDSLAEETYAENKDSADKLGEFILKNDIKRGNNAKDIIKSCNKPNTIAGERLLSFIERIERLEKEKNNLTEDIKEVYQEIKSVGIEAKIIRRMIKIRKLDKDKVAEENELLKTYADAIGMQYIMDI